MGLTVHYELRLPASMSSDDVVQVLAALHAHAEGLAVERVGSLAGPSRYGDVAADACLEFNALIIAEPYDDETPRLICDVATAQGFRVDPGEGCETAMFGFMRRADEAGGHQEWFWRCFCKTQYASIVSEQHFVACHTAVISLLDRAIELGVDVIVNDETQYWEMRDEKQLIDELHRMNRLIAAFAGKLSDALGPHDVQASIFAHPRFERLEMGE
jgi:hypothetical protein